MQTVRGHLALEDQIVSCPSSGYGAEEKVQGIHSPLHALHPSSGQTRGAELHVQPLCWGAGRAAELPW